MPRILTALQAAVIVAMPALAGGQPPERWIPTWFAATTARVDPSAAQASAPPPATRGQSLLHFNNQTLRQIVHVTLGGSRLRVVVSNTFGTTGLRIGAASVALRDRESAIVAASARPLTFGGAAQTTVPAGAVLLSDPVDQIGRASWRGRVERAEW